MFGPALDPAIIVPRSPRVIMNVCDLWDCRTHGTRHATRGAAHARCVPRERSRTSRMPRCKQTRSRPMPHVEVWKLTHRERRGRGARGRP